MKTLLTALLLVVSFNVHSDDTPPTFDEVLNSENPNDLLNYYRSVTFEEALNSDDPNDLLNYYRK